MKQSRDVGAASSLPRGGRGRGGRLEDDSDGAGCRGCGWLVAQTAEQGCRSDDILDSVVAMEAGSRTIMTSDEAAPDHGLVAQGDAVAEDEWWAAGEGGAQGGRGKWQGLRTRLR